MAMPSHTLVYAVVPLVSVALGLGISFLYCCYIDYVERETPDA